MIEALEDGVLWIHWSKDVNVRTMLLSAIDRKRSVEYYKTAEELFSAFRDYTEDDYKFYNIEIRGGKVKKLAEYDYTNFRRFLKIKEL